MLGLGLFAAMFASLVGAAHQAGANEVQPPPLCNHDAFHQELAAQSAKLERLEIALADTRVLAAFGGAKMRGPKVLRVVSCDGSFLEGTFGEPAYRALRATGLCDPPSSLPGPETMTRR